MKNILLTGGSGYFGSILSNKLLKRGYACTILDLNPLEDKPKDIKFIQGDIRDNGLIFKACEGIDIILHNVAQVPLAKNKELFESVNIDGTINILKNAVKQKVKKVVYTSSSAVFGVPKKNPVNEETLPTPMEAYGKAKYQAEQHCQKYVQNGLDVSIIRPRTIIGHGRLGIFQILFEWIYQGSNIPVFNEGNNIYQFIHADDLAEACILAGEKKNPDTFNIGAMKYRPLGQLLKMLCAYAKTGSKVKSVPMDPAVFAMKFADYFNLSPLAPYHALMYGRSLYFDTSKAERILHWHSKYDDISMFKQSFDWYCNNRERILKAKITGSYHKKALNQGILKGIEWLL